MRKKLLVRSKKDKRVLFGIRWDIENTYVLIGGPWKSKDLILDTLCIVLSGDEVIKIQEHLDANPVQRIRVERPYMNNDARLCMMAYLEENYFTEEIRNFRRLMG